MFFLSMVEQGNTIVRYPKNDHKGHLCMVQHKSNSNSINIAAQKVSFFVDAIFPFVVFVNFTFVL